MTCIAYEIPGDPVPKARPRVERMRGRIVTTTPKRTVAYEAAVRMHTTAALARARRAGVTWDAAGRIEVLLVTHRSTRHQFDLDNVAKAWADGAQSVLYANDAQIDALRIVRGEIDADRPRMTVVVWSMRAAEMAVTVGSAEDYARGFLRNAPSRIAQTVAVAVGLTGGAR